MNNLFIKYWYVLLLFVSWSCTSDRFANEKREKTEKLALVKDVEVNKESKGFEVDFSVSSKPEHREKAKNIDKYLSKLYKQKKFNGCVLVSEGGEIIFNSAYGYADFATETPLSSQSSFHLASVSKQFTAMAVMMLKEEGKLNIENDITEYIPEMPYKGIKIKHLLNHSSGLVNFLNYVPTYLNFWDSCQIAQNCEMPLILKEKQPRLQFRPGTRFAYNNTGYVLLAHLVERITEQSFQEFVQERIFDVLGMKHSKVVSLACEPVVPNRVYNYIYTRRNFELFDDDVRNGFVGEKGVYASVEDMYRWDQALYDTLLVKENTLKEIFEYSNLDNGRKIMYGYGWRKSKDNPDLVYHFGHWKGARACIMRYTDSKNTIIILNNTSNNTLKRIVAHVKKELENQE
ncbi:MAG: serine hydrolase domain-containing protein [Cytophagaceae bacterium]